MVGEMEPQKKNNGILFKCANEKMPSVAGIFEYLGFPAVSVAVETAAIIRPSMVDLVYEISIFSPQNQKS
jgi:hypothetical protein